MDSPERPTTEAGPRLAIAICCLAAMPNLLHALAQSMFGGLATDIRDSLEASTATMGLVAAAAGLPVTLLQPGAGALVDRLGARRTLPAATLGFAACWTWFVFSGSAVNSMAARFCLGAFAAFTYPAFIAVAVRLVRPEGRQKALGMMQMAISAASIAGSLAATPVLATDSWRLALGTIALAAVPLSLALWVTLAGPALRGRRSAGGGAPPTGILRMLAIPNVRRACIIATCTGGVMIAMGGLLNGVVARVAWKLPENAWGIANAAFFVGFALGGLLNARLVRALGARRTLCAALVFLAASLVAWTFAPPGLGLPAACAVEACCGLGASAMSVAVAVAIRAVPVESAGAASGLVCAAMTGSGMVIQTGAMATSLIPGTVPIERVHGSVVVVIALVLAAAWVARGIEEKSSAATD